MKWRYFIWLVDLTRAPVYVTIKQGSEGVGVVPYKGNDMVTWIGFGGIWTRNLAHGYVL